MGKQVTDRSSMRRYRTEIPNIVIDMDLSVYAFRLYVQLKRVAGDDGKCYYTARELAEQCRMSPGTISKAKQELLDADLIRIETGDRWVRDNITIVDMWPANFAHFAQENEVGTPDHHTITPDHHTITPDHHTITPDHHTITKEEPIKQEPIKREPKREGARAASPTDDVEFGVDTTTCRKPFAGDVSNGKVAPGTGDTPARIFHEVYAMSDYRLGATAMAEITSQVTDFSLWREVVIAWALSGNKPLNIRGQLDWYHEPSRFRRTKEQGRGAPATSKVAASLAAIDEYEAIRARHQGNIP